ncbi:MAG: methylaspartate ammonia-lyase [Defluviitaleaceae bacterium]|nr:methylaspartate ammonia-lyase [Defluviitaleaceae bacterium]
MKIVDMKCSAGYSGFFFDDKKAIKENAVGDGNAYRGTPVTQGFKAVRQPGESVSIMLVLENGQVAYGDCAAVQYSGAGGRDPLFIASDYIPVIEEALKPVLVGYELKNFREAAKKVDSLEFKGGKLHTAIRYGATQALLDAVSKAKGKLMAEVISEEYNTEISKKIIPIFTQSGDDRYLNADKMILKGVPALPHGLFNTIEKTGQSGQNLLAYVEWLRERIDKIKVYEDYKPIIHLDIYGTLGYVFDMHYDRIADYIGKLEEAARGLELFLEGPIETNSLDGQIYALKTLREKCEAKGLNVKIVADEWCNTYEDIIAFTKEKSGHILQIKTPDLGGINNSIKSVLHCKQHGMGAYLGGTCNETERSAQVCMHIAMATSPMQVLSKPGMGVDEGYMINYNEMQRILALTA